MTDDLVKRLTIKAGVMEMGEKIAWGSDTSLMREAANRIEGLEAKLAKAVDALERIDALDLRGVGCGSIAATTLAELKGETDARILSALSPDTPTPEALVKAALERAAVSISCACSGGVCEYPAKCPEADAAEIRALASDPETVAQIIEAAKGGR